MHYDLLIDPANTVFAVNCQVQGTTLHCGALYLEPLIHHQLIRLAYDGAILDVELPEELTNQPSAHRAWRVALPLKHVEVRDTSLRT